MSMHYEIRSEFGIKRFRKIEPLRDWLFQFSPVWSYKLEVFRIKKSGDREVGQFVKDKRVIIF